MRIAIDINKKLGGTRAYGKMFMIQKQKPIIEINLQSLDNKLTKTFIILGLKLIKEKKRKAKMSLILILKLDKNYTT